AEQPAGTRLVAIRETADGLFSCADDFVQRIDAPGKGTVTIHAARYGQPFAGATVALGLQAPQSGLGIGDPNAPNQPTAPIPAIGTPPKALTVPASMPTGPDGCAHLEIDVTSPGNPRGYLDGQIYLISYALDGEAANAHPQFDVIVVHARDGYTVPDKPA